MVLEQMSSGSKCFPSETQSRCTVIKNPLSYSTTKSIILILIFFLVVAPGGDFLTTATTTTTTTAATTTTTAAAELSSLRNQNQNILLINDSNFMRSDFHPRLVMHRNDQTRKHGFEIVDDG